VKHHIRPMRGKKGVSGRCRNTKGAGRNTRRRRIAQNNTKGCRSRPYLGGGRGAEVWGRRGGRGPIWHTARKKNKNALSEGKEECMKGAKKPRGRKMGRFVLSGGAIRKK